MKRALATAPADSVICVPQAGADTKQAMPPITYYGLDTSCKTVEHGVVTKEEAIQIVDKFAAMQVGLQGMPEEVVSNSMFGFSLDEHRFIEIAMETDAKFRVKLEMPGRLWAFTRRRLPWGLSRGSTTLSSISSLCRSMSSRSTSRQCDEAL